MSAENGMPKEDGLDQSLSLLREGYLYIPNRRRSFQENIFETRLMGKPAICMGGKEAAKLFYDPAKFQREGAAPKRVVKTLFGEGGVQTLDGEAHQHRKAAFMSLMAPKEVMRLTDIFVRQWMETAQKWTQQSEVVLYEEAKELLCRIACEWGGVPLPEDDVKRRTSELSAMFESSVSAGPEYWKTRRARRKAEKWVGGLIEEVRQNTLHPPEESALYVFSHHRELDGQLLDTKTAAVEVLNILRPITAVSIYLAFTALALHQFPEEKPKLMDVDEPYTKYFVQEVRRFYPFFPFTGAKVKTDFEWSGMDFKEGTLALLDLYGTNHDPELWENPDLFQPARFEDWDKSPFDFIPQGGGDYYAGHRCAGEWITIELMKVSVDFLVNRLSYTVPDQDISFSMTSMPSMPKSGFIVRDISINLRSESDENENK
ncbi:cytochrome P450 [Domibacillus iocasae]|uniref:Cytochrome n=1 Tax=Domibacillus iocasae TaxID=1714016 RepID=A0A1E7DJX8_9BACI|nr:cytochrome P450 [Domibacillus iocasae]OES43392.1 cytochrome [Domibacillus iocasae]